MSNVKGCVNCGADDHDTKDCTRLPVVAWLCEWMADKRGGVHSGLSKTSLEGLRRSQGEDVLIVSDEPLCRLTDAQALIAELQAENTALEQDYLRIISAQDEKHRQQVAQLRQHKTEYMEAAEQTRKALEARIAELEAPMLEWAELDYTKHTRRSLMCYIGQQNFKITAQAKRIASLESHIRTDNSETLVNALAEVERLKKTVAHWQGLAVANRDVADKALAQLEQLQAAPAERGVVLPERMETEAFTTIDKGSKNYKAGWNRALNEVARLNPAPAAQPVADELETFRVWWRAPEQEELRKSCAEGWGSYIWSYLAARSPAEQPGLSVPEGWHIQRVFNPNGYTLQMPTGGFIRVTDYDGGGIETAFSKFIGAVLSAAAPSVSDKVKGE